MKKISTAKTTAQRDCRRAKLTIGMDLGDRAVVTAFWTKKGGDRRKQSSSDYRKWNQSSLWRHAAMPDRDGNRVPIRRG